MSFPLAVLLNQATRLQGVLRSVYFLPYVTSGIAVYFAWQYILQPDGAVNLLLGRSDSARSRSRRAGSATRDTALPTLIVVTVWGAVPVAMLLYLTGLQTIDRSVLEAAQLDGAGWWRTNASVVWPLLRPITAIVVLLNLRDSLQGFQTFLVMTNGGPGDHTNVLGLEAYRLAFLKNLAPDPRPRQRARLAPLRRRAGPRPDQSASRCGARHDDDSPRPAPPAQRARPGRGAGTPVRRGPAPHGSVARAVVGLLLAGYGPVSLYPFLWMVSAAFKDQLEVVSGGHLIPQHPTFDTLIDTWNKLHFFDYFLNSLLVTALHRGADAGGLRGRRLRLRRAALPRPRRCCQSSSSRCCSSPASR